MMKKSFIHVVLLACFMFWLLPLGRFIDPAREAQACGGQRAVCMCSHTNAKSAAKPLEGLAKTGSGTQKEQAPGGASHHFLSAGHFLVRTVLLVNVADQMPLAYRNPFLKSIEHIPKA